MIKRIKCCLLLLFLFLFSGRNVFAGGFNLKSIGSVDTSGRQISHWWYTGSVPTMNGEATAGGTVTISIDGTEATATVDGDGNWTYVPGALDDGDHQVTLTSGGSTISFTLTMGAENVDWGAVESGSGDALPAAGVLFPTLGLTTIGSVFVLISKKIAKQI
jgi:hypothetical protein